jgi:hypothetical protein
MPFDAWCKQPSHSLGSAVIKGDDCVIEPAGGVVAAAADRVSHAGVWRGLDHVL